MYCRNKLMKHVASLFPYSAHSFPSCTRYFFTTTPPLPKPCNSRSFAAALTPSLPPPLFTHQLFFVHTTLSHIYVHPYFTSIHFTSFTTITTTRTRKKEKGTKFWNPFCSSNPFFCRNTYITGERAQLSVAN